jgi:type II secretory ATPase GspE/PulE/Tfp pilus assembly ATPase PilB-like protein
MGFFERLKGGTDTTTDDGRADMSERTATGRALAPRTDAPNTIDSHPGGNAMVSKDWASATLPPLTKSQAILQGASRPIARAPADVPPVVEVIRKLGGQNIIENFNKMFAAYFTDGRRLIVLSTRPIGDVRLGFFIQQLKSIQEVSDTIHASHDLIDLVHSRADAIADNDKMGVTENSAQQAFIASLILRAVEANASDIHIEYRNSHKERSGKVMFRIDGEMIEQRQAGYTDHAMLDAGVRALYQGAFTDKSSTSAPMFAEHSSVSAIIRIPEIHECELRFQTIRDKDGYDCVVRVLASAINKVAELELPKLGFSKQQSEDLMRGVTCTHGLSVIGGATGAGKTSSIAAMLAQDPDKAVRKRFSIEDPPENNLKFVTQFPVQRAADAPDDIGPMLEAMRATLRGDPDLISTGEIRDASTAEMAQDMALTGHVVLSTLHVSSAFGVVRRLLSSRIHLDPEVLSSRGFLNVISFQTLVPKLCTACRVPITEGLAAHRIETIRRKFGVSLQNAFTRRRKSHLGQEAHCASCGGSGIKGRTVCAEVVLVDDVMRKLISEGKLTEAEAHWRNTRLARFDQENTKGKTYYEHAVYKVTTGEICASNLFTLWDPEHYSLISRPCDKD